MSTHLPRFKLAILCALYSFLGQPVRKFHRHLRPSTPAPHRINRRAVDALSPPDGTVEDVGLNDFDGFQALDAQMSIDAHFPTDAGSPDMDEGLPHHDAQSPDIGPMPLPQFEYFNVWSWPKSRWAH